MVQANADFLEYLVYEALRRGVSEEDIYEEELYYEEKVRKLQPIIDKLLKSKQRETL